MTIECRAQCKSNSSYGAQLLTRSWFIEEISNSALSYLSVPICKCDSHFRAHKLTNLHFQFTFSIINVKFIFYYLIFCLHVITSLGTRSVYAYTIWLRYKKKIQFVSRKKNVCVSRNYKNILKTKLNYAWLKVCALKNSG